MRWPEISYQCLSCFSLFRCALVVFLFVRRRDSSHSPPVFLHSFSLSFYLFYFILFSASLKLFFPLLFSLSLLLCWLYLFGIIFSRYRLLLSPCAAVCCCILSHNSAASLAICQHVMFKTWPLVRTEERSFTMNHRSLKLVPRTVVFLSKFSAGIDWHIAFTLGNFSVSSALRVTFSADDFYIFYGEGGGGWGGGEGSLYSCVCVPRGDRYFTSEWAPNAGLAPPPQLY